MGIKNGTEVTLDLSSDVIRNSNDEYNFPHKLLLTNAEVSRLLENSANNSSAHIKLPNKTGQLGAYLGTILEQLPKVANEEYTETIS